MNLRCFTNFWMNSKQQRGQPYKRECL
uniref:Uncharacterized protein n=1 Tax=Anguilla anguilla TaxID=7936 RepID=A0A0E9T5H8_ANGAN